MPPPTPTTWYRKRKRAASTVASHRPATSSRVPRWLSIARSLTAGRRLAAGEAVGGDGVLDVPFGVCDCVPEGRPFLRCSGDHPPSAGVMPQLHPLANLEDLFGRHCSSIPSARIR